MTSAPLGNGRQTTSRTLLSKHPVNVALINAVGIIYQWDKYPFILLNLAFSAQASYAAPLILMASNRSAQRDRLTLEHDAEETDTILKIQDTQLELLRAIKAQTDLLETVVKQTEG